MEPTKLLFLPVSPAADNRLWTTGRNRPATVARVPPPGRDQKAD
jgi:hypothetical protein